MAVVWELFTPPRIKLSWYLKCKAHCNKWKKFSNDFLRPFPRLYAFVTPIRCTLEESWKNFHISRISNFYNRINNNKHINTDSFSDPWNLRMGNLHGILRSPSSSSTRLVWRCTQGDPGDRILYILFSADHSVTIRCIDKYVESRLYYR